MTDDDTCRSDTIIYGRGWIHHSVLQKCLYAGGSYNIIFQQLKTNFAWLITTQFGAHILKRVVCRQFHCMNRALD